MAKGKSKSYGQELSKLKANLWKHRELIMNGRLLAIDPSCISTSSLPGYAIYDRGNFIEGGVLNIKHHPDLYRRLSRIRHCMQMNFNQVDVVAIEKVPIVPLFSRKQAEANGKPWLNVKSINSLTQAIGAFKCSFPEDIPIIDVSSGVWSYEAKTRGFKEAKGDDADAIAIGRVAIEMTRDLIGEVDK